MASAGIVAKLRRHSLPGVWRWTPSRNVVTKTTTGIVGLNVDPNGRTNLIAAYEKILTELQVGSPTHARGTLHPESWQAIPEDAAYRKAVEAIATYRIKTAQELEDVRSVIRVTRSSQHAGQEAAIEEEIGMGQLEELIEWVLCTIIQQYVLCRQANDELECIKDYKGASATANHPPRLSSRGQDVGGHQGVKP